MNVLVHDLGLIEYQAARAIQERLAGEIAAGSRPPALLLLEHPHTFTFGRRGDEAHLLWDEAERARRGIAVHWADRGGDVTYHGPGQLVGYPLLPLGPVESAREGSGWLPQADYVGYLRKLEETLIRALLRLGLAAGRVEGRAGVWVQPDIASRCPRCRPEDRRRPAKIAAVGVKVDARGVTRHGFALNVDPDMSYWDGIVACGLADAPAVALADLLDPCPPMGRVKAETASAFADVFACEVLPAPLPD